MPFDGDLEDYAKWLDETAVSGNAAAAGASTEGASTTRVTNAGVSGGAAAPAGAAQGGAAPANADSAGAEQRGADRSAVSPPPQGESAEARKQRKREEAERRNRLTPLKAKIAKFDEELARLATRSAELQRELAAPDIYSTGAKERLKDLLSQQAQVARETERVETAWLEASEELEEQSRQLG
jgi:hypothetical protein